MRDVNTTWLMDLLMDRNARPVDRGRVWEYLAGEKNP